VIARGLHDWWRARRVLARPGAFARVRRAGVPGALYRFLLRDGRAVYLRGGSRDFHVFHRVFVRDEYRLGGLDVGPESTVVDLGAHSGLFALRVAADAGRIVCVEPAPENLALLRRHVSENGLEARVAVVAAAVHGAHADLELVRGGDPYAHAVRERESESTLPAVRGLTLAGLFEEHAVRRCALLKLDCEGSEFSILEEAGAATLRACKRIRLEFHAANAPEAPARLRRHLESHGFLVERFHRKPRSDQGYIFCARREA
jgi:FkbM family methyltransferase